MSTAVARDLIADIAGPIRLGENIKSSLAMVARKTGLSDRRVRALWHREARRIDAEEMETLRRAAGQERKNEDAELVARIEELEARLRSITALLGVDEADTARAAAGRLRSAADRVCSG